MRSRRSSLAVLPLAVACGGDYVPSGQQWHGLVAAPSNPDVLYVASEAGSENIVYRSDNAGLAWRPVARPWPQEAEQYDNRPDVDEIAVAPDDPDDVIVLTRSGDLYRSDDG